MTIKFTLSVTAVTLAAGMSLPSSAATITYAPGGGAEFVAANVPSGNVIHTGLAQSVTAVDTNVSFGFYLYGTATSQVLYSLYAGDGLFGTALKQVVVTSPLAPQAASFLVSADFSDVSLVVGQRYTFKVSLPGEGLPPTNQLSSTLANFALNGHDPTGQSNAYAGGRFYFTDNPYPSSVYATYDLAFSMVGVTANGAVPEPATWAMMIAGFGVVGGAMRRKRVAVSFA